MGDSTRLDLISRGVVAVCFAAIGMVIVTMVSEASGAPGPTVVDIDYAATDAVEGVYITHSDGRIDARDGLPHFGDLPSLIRGESVVALSVRPSADGYWLFTSIGRVLAFGAADFYGDATSLRLDQPIISATATADGLGYLMVAEDGGIFTFGRARFRGSVPQMLPRVQLDEPVVGIVPTPRGNGYLLVAADGGVFTFGDARFHGSVPAILPGVDLDAEIVAVIAQPSGYLMVAADGGIFTFGDVDFLGSLGGSGATGIVAVAVEPDGSGYVMVDSAGLLSPFGSADSLGSTETSALDTVPTASVTVPEGDPFPTHGWCVHMTASGRPTGTTQALTEAECAAMTRPYAWGEGSINVRECVWHDGSPTAMTPLHYCPPEQGTWGKIPLSQSTITMMPQPLGWCWDPDRPLASGAVMLRENCRAGRMFLYSTRQPTCADIAGSLNYRAADCPNTHEG